MFSKMTFSVLVSGLSVMADCFSSAAFGCFSMSFFLMSVVISVPSKPKKTALSAPFLDAS